MQRIVAAILFGVMCYGVLPWRSAGALSDVDGLQGAGPVDAEPEALRDGLIARYHSLVDAGVQLARIEPKPALWLVTGSLHPRLPPGPFEATWTGLIHLRDATPVRFDFEGAGEIEMEVDGQSVLAGASHDVQGGVGPGTPFHRPPGFYRLTLRYRSPRQGPARLLVHWQGGTFAREPLPPWILTYRPNEAARDIRNDAIVEQGRQAVARWGCARCHASAFPAVHDPPPGPSLADAGSRLRREWFLTWLAQPARVRSGTSMPSLFVDDRTGYVERWLVAEYVIAATRRDRPKKSDRDADKSSPPTVSGDHRMGRTRFISAGCPACHFVPDVSRDQQPDLQRTRLQGLADRFSADDLAQFVRDPQRRYPDHRMPQIPLELPPARDIAAYLLLWSKPAKAPATSPPTPDEINAVASRLGVQDPTAAGQALVREKRCAACHPGLPAENGVELRATDDVPLVKTKEQGCLAGTTGPRFVLEPATRAAIGKYLEVARSEKYDSPYDERQRLVRRLGCVRCHQRDSDQPPPIEVAASLLGGSGLERVPYQHLPRLTFPLDRLQTVYLRHTLHDGVAGLRSGAYTYRMPAFGEDADTVLHALAEADGWPPDDAPPSAERPDDPTRGPANGPILAGFQGYSCVSCHVWNDRLLSDPDPGAIGPDLTRTAGRIRREWFQRFLENPLRYYPGTPMPSAFQHGQSATLRTLLDGDAQRQRDALWEYLALGKSAPSPKPSAPLPVSAPSPGEPPIVAQIPLRFSDRSVVESLTMLTGNHDLVVYDLGQGQLHKLFVGAQIERRVQGRLRTYTAAGREIPIESQPGFPWGAAQSDAVREPESRTFQGYDRVHGGARLRWLLRFGSVSIEVVESCWIEPQGTTRQLVRELHAGGVPADLTLVWSGVRVHGSGGTLTPIAGTTEAVSPEGALQVRCGADAGGQIAFRVAIGLPPSENAPPFTQTPVPDVEPAAGSLQRPGYHAVELPRPKAVSGEDLVMPSALAVDPTSGRLLVASMKLGEILALDHPRADLPTAHFRDYTRGLFQEAYSMWAEKDALYVLHRRNLTRVVDSDGDGQADRFDRVAALPHGIADTYDYAYGLVREPSGSFVISYAPYANNQLPGSGGALRLLPDGRTEPFAFGFRNPLGWCLGPDREIFCTDNQGEWVATNKLCHVAAGRYFGFPNPGQPEQAQKPRGKAAVWVPYGWAHSINGVTCDTTGGKFGPFAGQVFMAELMFGGGIVRADLERVNGEYQGACFPFWGPGLLGPLCLAFDPQGPLYVGSITEPGWMAQPDRGAVYRIDFTGEVPFEMQSIHVLPRGFHIVFTRPLDARTAADAASYAVEHFRYEYTGAYGSPELDRTASPIEHVAVSADGRAVDLTTAPLVRDRVYMISARGVRSTDGAAPVFPTGAYTLNEVPVER